MDYHTTKYEWCNILADRCNNTRKSIVCDLMQPWLKRVNLMHDSQTQQELLLDFNYFSQRNSLQVVEISAKLFFLITCKIYSNTKLQEGRQQED